MKITKVIEEPTLGVVFWWSNIFRSYQLRVSIESGTVNMIPRLYPDRAAIEKAAAEFAETYNLDVYEIEIPQVTQPLGNN